MVKTIQKGIPRKTFNYLVVLVCCTGVVTCFLGAYYGLLRSKRTTIEVSTVVSLRVSSGLLYGSKQSKKFGFPWCNGPSRLKLSNRVVFTSFNDAIEQGFNPTKVCKGLG